MSVVRVVGLGSYALHQRSAQSMVPMDRWIMSVVIIFVFKSDLWKNAMISYLNTDFAQGRKPPLGGGKWSCRNLHCVTISPYVKFGWVWISNDRMHRGQTDRQRPNCVFQFDNIFKTRMSHKKCIVSIVKIIDIVKVICSIFQVIIQETANYIQIMFFKS